MKEILAGISEEDRLTEGVTWKEFLLPANRWRMFIVITLQIGVQLTGNTSLAYCRKPLDLLTIKPLTSDPVSPQIFQAVGAGEKAFLFSGFFGLVKVISCGFFLLFLVERIGRKGALIFGAFMMSVYMAVVAAITATNPPVPGGGLSSASVASLTMIYLEASESRHAGEYDRCVRN